MKKQQAPKYLLKFFRWFCHPDYAEDIEGDLHEKFDRNLQQHGYKSARWKSIWAVITLFRPELIRPFEITFLQNTNIMFRHNFKISLRTLWRDKGFSFINIGGLALGMAVTLLISLWIWDEMTYNKNHENYDRIGQVKGHQTYRGERFTGESLFSALGKVLRESYKNHLEYVVMGRQTEEHIISFENNSFTQLGNFMSPEAPQMLTLKMLEGTQNGLKDANSILLSKTLAAKLFGKENPINQVLTIDTKALVTVTGVYEDLPRNSEFWETSYISPIDLYFSMTGLDPNAWSNYNMNIYAQLREGKDFATVSSLIKNEVAIHMEEEKAIARKPELFIQPMSQWHLYDEFENGVVVASEHVKFVWFYAIIGFFVLLLACINFMNLSTARSEKRAKEIGVRKSIGSGRFQLVYQFLSESLLVAVFAFLCAFVLVWFLLPWFNELAGKEMSLPLANPWLWVASIGFTLITGLLAGSYPAIYLSSFSPVASLKGIFRIGRFAALPRKTLVVFQFTISIAFIIGTLLVYQQIQYAKNRSVGYSRSGLLMLPKRAADLYGKYPVFREELKNTNAVLEIAEANYPLTNTLGSNTGFDWEGRDPSSDPSFNTIVVNHEYGQTVEWELVAGRDFSRDFPTDTAGVIITESAQKIMGLENPLGMNLHHAKGYWGGTDFTILGVVKDLIKDSPFQSPYPGIMFLTERELSYMFVRLNPQIATNEALTKIESAFKKIAPTAPFDFKFMDAEYHAKFRAEERIGKLAIFFTALAVLISCMGLFGLAAFMAERRTKEIGIRKVLGASVFNLWQMLSKDFIILVIIACFIAIPLSYYVLDNWLQSYEYRTPIAWWIFVVVGLFALFLTLITVSFQALKAALMNPVKAIKSE